MQLGNAYRIRCVWKAVQGFQRRTYVCTTDIQSRRITEYYTWYTWSPKGTMGKSSTWCVTRTISMPAPSSSLFTWFSPDSPNYELGNRLWERQVHDLNPTDGSGNWNSNPRGPGSPGERQERHKVPSPAANREPMGPGGMDTATGAAVEELPSSPGSPGSPGESNQRH